MIQKKPNETKEADLTAHPEVLDFSTTPDYVKEVSAKARSGFKWFAITNTIWQAIAWLFTLIIIRFLTPTDYGLFSLAETVVPYLGLITGLHIAVWIVRTDRVDKESQKTFFTLTMSLGTAMSLLAFFIAPLIAKFYDNTNLKVLLQAISIIFFLRGLYAVPDALLRRELKFKQLALIELTVGILRALITLVLAVSGMGYWALVLGLLFKEVAMAVCIVTIRGLPGGFRWDPTVVRNALAFGFPATGAAALAMIYTTADDIFVGKLLGVEILGYYAMAYFLMDMPMAKLHGIVSPILLPYFSRLQNHTRELLEIFLRINRAFMLVVAPVLVGMAVTAVEAVPIIFGEKWIPMTKPLIGLSIFGVIYSLTIHIFPLLNALGYPKKVFFINLVSTLILPASFFVLCRKYGVDGIIAAWFIIFPIISVLQLRALREITGLAAWQYLKNLRAPLFAAGTMGVVLTVCGAMLSPLLPSIGLLSAKIVFGVIIYAAILWLVFREETLELSTLLVGTHKATHTAGPHEQT